MTRRMLIDATHPEETRVVVVNGNRLEEFDYETTTKKQIKGNVYLAKVTRVEPSLQALSLNMAATATGSWPFQKFIPTITAFPSVTVKNWSTTIMIPRTMTTKPPIMAMALRIWVRVKALMKRLRKRPCAARVCAASTKFRK